MRPNGLIHGTHAHSGIDEPEDCQNMQMIYNGYANLPLRYRRRHKSGPEKVRSQFLSPRQPSC